jgi:hypothetical protein
MVHAMHDAREAGISTHRRCSREHGAGHRTMTVTATVWVGGGVTLAITFASDVIAGEFAYDILTVMAVLIAVVVSVVAVRTAFTDRMLVISHCQVQVDSESRRQRRQDRHCDEQMASA